MYFSVKSNTLLARQRCVNFSVQKTTLGRLYKHNGMVICRVLLTTSIGWLRREAIVRA